jgi:hypothetical protein
MCAFIPTVQETTDGSFSLHRHRKADRQLCDGELLGAATCVDIYSGPPSTRAMAWMMWTETTGWQRFWQGFVCREKFRWQVVRTNVAKEYVPASTCVCALRLVLQIQPLYPSRLLTDRWPSSYSATKNVLLDGILAFWESMIRQSSTIVRYGRRASLLRP